MRPRSSRASGATFHFNPGINILPGIDHALGSERVRLGEAGVVRERFGAYYPSDHYPVWTTVVVTGRGGCAASPHP